MATRKTGTPRPRRGLDPWRSAEGIRFATWDQWFLLLIFVEHDGDWVALRDRLRDRCVDVGFERDDTEAKLSHLGDLRARWASLGARGRDRLRRSCDERRLLRRARAKILEQPLGEHDKTPAMRETPRILLCERALRGYWTRFPVSPAPYEAAFRDTLDRQPFYGENATFGLARRLDRQMARALDRATDAADEVAVRRAFLTSLVCTMERADDSCGGISGIADEYVSSYFTAPWREAGLSAELFYRDCLEWIVWEDYALSWRKTAPLFRAVKKDQVALVDALLREIETALREADADLGSQAEEALSLRGELHVVRRRFSEFERLATEMGSRHWERIATMAEAAVRSHRLDVARAVFAAADQPGAHRDHLRQQSRRLLRASASRGKPRLRLVRSSSR